MIMPTEPPPDPMHDPASDPALPEGVGQAFVVTCGVALATLAVQLYPFDFQGATGRWLALTPTTPMALVGNVLLFVPLGVVEFGLAYRLFGGRGWLVALVALDVALLALVGESAQLWLGSRDSSVIDLVANALGGLMGAMAGAAILAEELASEDDRGPREGPG